MDFFASGKVRRMAVGGALGGFVTYLIINPSCCRREAGGHPHDLFGGLSSALFSALVLGIIIGSAVGSALIACEEIGTYRAKRTVILGFSGSVVGAICGSIGSVIGQIIFGFMCAGGSIMGPLSPIVLIAARTIAWAVIGAGTGMCQGVVRKSPKLINMGLIGGLLGGGAGGFLFDIIGFVTQGGSTSRFIGFTIMGAAIGIAVGMVEELRKEQWLTVLSGTKEGRSYILTKPVTLIGRDELADIPLFGDQTVQKQHARITLSGDSAQLGIATGFSALVNAQPVSTAALNDGDMITIGKHRLRYSSKHSSTSSSLISSTIGSSVASTPQSSTTVPRLTVMSGPHMGESFVLHTSPYLIGRDPTSHVCLGRDQMISWKHATVCWDGSAWRVDDNGSTNGLYVNNQRVSTHVLTPGDQISVGQTILQAS